MTVQAIDFRSAPDILFRMIGRMFRKYSRDPSSRVSSSRLLLTYALWLYAAHTSPAEATEVARASLAALANADGGGT